MIVLYAGRETPRETHGRGVYLKTDRQTDLAIHWNEYNG